MLPGFQQNNLKGSMAIKEALDDNYTQDRMVNV